MKVIIENTQEDVIHVDKISSHHTIVTKIGGSYGLITANNYKSSNYNNISLDGFTINSKHLELTTLYLGIKELISKGHEVYAFNSFKGAAKFLSEVL